MLEAKRYEQAKPADATGLKRLFIEYPAFKAGWAGYKGDEVVRLDGKYGQHLTGHYFYKRDRNFIIPPSIQPSYHL